MSNTVFAGGRYALCLSLILVLARAQAADLYVSTSGNDSNAGTSGQPFRTITYAYSKAAAGTTIHVLPGVYYDYTSGWGIHLGKSGTASSPIVLHSETRGGAIIDGQNASDRNQGFYIDGNYNTVDGFEIRNCTLGGISIWANNNRIINNNIHNNGNPASSSTNGRDGVYSNEGTSGNYYAGNASHDNGRTGSNYDHGFYLCGQNETLINNLMYRNASSGVQIAGYTTVSNMKVYNNVMAWNGRQGIILWMALSGVDIKNNIIYQNAQYGVHSSDAHGSGVVFDHNLNYGNGSADYDLTGAGSDYSYTMGTTISSDPRFVNNTSASFDPHLGSGSPCIGAGLNLSSTITTDINGTTRPASGAWDLGAIVSGSGSTNTAPPVVTLTSPANGATYTAPATINLTASVTANGHAITKVQFYEGTTLLAEGTTIPYSFIYTNVSPRSCAMKAEAVYDSGDTVSSPSITVAVAAPTSSSNLSFTADSGAISAPFYITNGAIVQPASTSLGAGGQAIYTFNLSAAGNYVVSALVNAPATDNNSFFVNIDAQPTDPLMIWDIPVTSGFASHTVAWRGTGTADANQFAPKIFALSVGTHQLIVCGREGNCQLGSISVTSAGTDAPQAPLHITLQAGNLQVRWPTNFGNYVLQSKIIASPISDWVDVTNAPVIDQDQYNVSYPASGAGAWYRLRSQ